MSHASRRCWRRARRQHLTVSGAGPVASFLVVSDPDPARREAFAARAVGDLAPTTGLTTGRMVHGDTLILWTASTMAPLSTHADADGCALLLGDAILPGADHRVDARSLLHDWLSRTTIAPPTYDGLHVAIAVRGRDVAIGGDVLGLVPIVYAAAGPARIAGSSSALFSRHPLFDDGLDVRGLFGHLLTGGPVEGRTLRRGVTRLGAGRLLRWSGTEPAQECAHYSAPPAGLENELDFDAGVERYDAALHAAVRRHGAVHTRLSLLLSGGRDSRLLGGYASRDRSLSEAFTLGAPADHDAACAARVAHALRTSHRIHDPPFSAFPRHADRNVRHELLSGGMSNVHTWAGVDALAGIGGGMLSGYLLEVRQIAPVPQTIGGMLDWTYAHAMTPSQLRALVQPHLRATVDATADAIAQRLTDVGVGCAAGAYSNERSWRWFLSTNARFHAGAVPWRYASAAWPVLPILDQDFLRTLQGMPPAWLDGRRTQDAVLRRHFPALARLPLDRNADDVRPLAPSALYLVRDALTRTLARRQRGPSVERRYYARMYDFDNPGWQLIRASAEAGRPHLAEWFDADALERLLPAPGHTAAHADPIADGFAPKLLTGFMRALVLGDLDA